jgi:hypothetical protein
LKKLAYKVKMEATNWIKLDSSKLTAIEDETSPTGVRLQIYMSPYDVPEAFRVFENGSSLVIAFRYIEEENTEEKLMENGIKVKIGRKRRRLFEIHIPKTLLLQKLGDYLLPEMQRWSRLPYEDMRLREVFSNAEKVLEPRKQMLDEMVFA